MNENEKNINRKKENVLFSQNQQKYTQKNKIKIKQHTKQKLSIAISFK